LCGKASIETIRSQFPPIQNGPEIDPQILLGLPEKMRRGQLTFDRTGGLHAAAIFDTSGRLLILREDVARHNAVDKTIGRALLDGILPLSGHILLVSGRVSFEIMQKALAAGVPIVAAVSAPSTLAVDFARANGQKLAGFLRDDRMNFY
jgi:FdhD protein